MLNAVNIEKSFFSEDAEVAVLKGVTVQLDESDYVAIVGRSGSGKTTLLNVLSTLVRPDNGSLTYNGADLSSASERDLDEIRRADFSVIFQFHHLLPYLSVLENTLLPFMGTLKPVSGRLQQRGAPELTWYRAVLTQGWKRQLRRMFAAVGAPVERLVRVRIGTLRLDDLAPGECRRLTSAERERLAATRAAR